MRIYPKDLGTKWHILIVQERTRSWWSRLWNRGSVPEPHLGQLGRVWNRRLHVDEDVAAATFPLSSEETLPFVYGLGIPVGASALGAAVAFLVNDQALGASIALGLGGAGSWASTVAIPRAMLARRHAQAISPEEIEAVIGSDASGPLLRRLASQFMGWLGAGASVAADPLERDYLSLVLETIRRDIPAESEEDVRSALRALGEAITHLPPPIERSDETETIRQRAQAWRTRAVEESDRVVAESLERQADALDRQADSLDEANRLARRIRVLRQEMATQIEAFRSGLAVYAASKVDRADILTDCADAVRDVAAEANAAAAARAELDAVITRAAQAEMQQEIRLGRQEW